MKREVNWQSAEFLPSGETMVLAWCPPSKDFPRGRMMIWRSDILFRNLEGPTPEHLQFPATHWAHLPAPPI